jgi:hypothetical protein
MAWRLAKSKAHLYGFGHALKWIAVSGGLIFVYSFATTLMNLFGVNFVIMGDAVNAPVRIGLTSRFQPMENAFWLSNGINWLEALSSFFAFTQVALLGIMALLFFRAYLHNAYWLKQST